MKKHINIFFILLISQVLIAWSPPPINAAFSVSPNTGCSAPLTVFFSDLSTDPDTWLWDFGDGGTSTAQNPTHTYLTMGVFPVKLTITDTIFGTMSIAYDTVKVANPPDIVTNSNDAGAGSLRQIVLDACPGDTVTFDPSTNGNTITLTTGEIAFSKELYIFGNGEPNTIIDGNSNSRIFNINNASNVEINLLTIQNGNTTTGDGGGIYCNNTALSLEWITLKNNSAVNGGGLYALDEIININNATVQGNSAQQRGGGITTIKSSGPPVTAFSIIQNTLITGNVATIAGGAYPTYSRLDFFNTTIAGNYASDEGGGLAGIFIPITNCVIWGNIAAANNSTNEVYATLFLPTYNLVKDNPLAGTGNLDGTLMSNDPLFINPIPASPTPTVGGDYRLMCNSPLIDAGDNTVNTVLVDLDNNNRVQDGDANTSAIIDIGTYENPLPIPNPQIVINSNDAGIGSLRQAVIDACPGDTITFNPSTNGNIITLTSGEILIKKKLYIFGNGETNTAIDGNANSRIFNVNNAWYVEINKLTIQNGNNATGSGGGIFVDNTQLILNEISLISNNATSGGGLLTENATVAINNSTIRGNRATIGGGGVFFGVSSQAILTNTLIAGNSVIGTIFETGGGIFTVASSTLLLINSTVVNNYADGDKGGIGNDFTCINSIVWGNIDGSGSSNTNGIVTATYSLIEGLNPLGIGNLDGTNPINDPLFINPITASSTPTINGDYRLRCLSPAIDAGDNASNPTLFDLDNNDRILDGDNNSTNTIDFGSYEFIYAPPPTAAFAVNQTTVCSTQSVSFTDQSAPLPASWLWNFGDSDTSTIQNPIHNYTTLNTFTITLIAANAVGCADTITTTIFVGDTTAPTITCPTNQIVAANSSCQITLASYTGLATTSDNCDVNPTVTQTPVSGTTLSANTTVWLFSTDALGNVDSCSFLVIIVDSTAPTITCPANQIVTANSSCQITLADYTNMATTSDNCDANPTLTQNPIAGTMLNANTTVWLFSTDVIGNVDSCSFLVTITDTIAPSITCVGNQNVNFDNNCQFVLPNYTNLIPTSDNCSSTVTVTQNPTTGTIITATQTITIVADDGNGNLDSCSFDVIPSDTIAPNITCIGNQNVGFDANCQFTLPDYASLITTSDNCSAIITVTQNPTAGTIITATQAITVIANDGNGNLGSCTFDVIPSDTIAPTITCLGNVSSCSPLVTYAMPTATDNCGTTTITQIAGLASGSNFAVGVTTNTFMAQDNNGNTDTCSFDIEIYPLPIISQTSTQVTCNGLSDGSIDATITNGTIPYVFNWSNSATTEDITGLVAETYIVIVSDSNTCQDTLTITISEPQPLAINETITTISCFGLSDGAITTNISGGTFPYTYSWSNSTSAAAINGLSTGNYTITITDSNNCTVNESYTITEPEKLILDTILSHFGNYNVSTLGACDGDIDLLVSGGVNPYLFNWDNGELTEDLFDLCAGTYSVEVIDMNNCTSTISITLIEPDEIKIPEGFSPNGDGINDIFIIEGIDIFPENNLIIFNRWGNTTYQASPYNNDWDGSSEKAIIGNQVPDGSYFYKLKLSDEDIRTGYIVIKR